MNDPVNSPSHYTAIPATCACGLSVQPIAFTRHMNFNLGNAVKYALRAPFKGNTAEDLLKARWYINDELRRLGYVEKPEVSVVPGSPIAAGHNPRNLTEDLVGIADGWRLVELDEFENVKAPDDLEVMCPDACTWDDSNYAGDRLLITYSFTYRTKQPKA